MEGRARKVIIIMNPTLTQPQRKFSVVAFALPGSQAQKESALKKNLSKYTNVSGRVGLLPVPLCPEVEVLGVKADGCFMFRSALYPAVVTFKKQPDETILREEVQRRKAEMTRRTSLNNKKISKVRRDEKKEHREDNDPRVLLLVIGCLGS